MDVGHHFEWLLLLCGWPLIYLSLPSVKSRHFELLYNLMSERLHMSRLSENRKGNILDGGKFLINLKNGKCHYPLDGKPSAWMYRARLNGYSLQNTCWAIDGEVFPFCTSNTLPKRDLRSLFFNSDTWLTHASQQRDTGVL